MGALLGKSWCRWLGIVAAALNLLLVLGAVGQGTGLAAIAWSVIPVILLIYLFSPAGRKALRAA